MNPIIYDYGFSGVRDKEVRDLIQVGLVLPLFITKCLGLEMVAFPSLGSFSKYQAWEC